MGDPETKETPSETAAPPVGEPEEAPAAAPAATPAPAATLEQARRFLQTDAVRLATREKKADFLRGKGLQEAQIDALLKEEEEKQRAEAEADAKRKPNETTTTITTPNTTSPQPPSPSPPPQQEQQPAPAEKKTNHPPIVTYPEFLTTPPPRPPLVTAAGFQSALYAFGGLSALIYGASRLVLAPMADALAGARAELHETAGARLGELVGKLEGVVSEVPPPSHGPGKAPAASDDGVSSCGDPTELFHRDVGVQTSLPPSPVLAGTQPEWPATAAGAAEQPAAVVARQAGRISELVASVKTLSEGFAAQSDGYTDVQAALDLFRVEVDRVSNRRAARRSLGTNSVISASPRNEPDDEIRKAKENIRRLKGILLSARSFPASTR